MKHFFLSLVLVSSIFCTVLASKDKRWREWKIEFGRKYGSEEGEASARKIFDENDDIIEKHNERFERKETTWKMCHNKFSDWSHEYFQSILTIDLEKKPTKAGPTPYWIVPKDFTAPNVNLTTEKVPIKDQGQCGASWAFAGVGVLEYFQLKKSGKYLELSEQNLIGCDSIDTGCTGGWTTNSYEYYFQNGLDFASVYPYLGEADGTTCKYINVSIPKMGLSKKDSSSPKQYYTVNPCEISMAYALDKTKTWLSATVYASYWQFYCGGIMDRCGCDQGNVNHAVNIVGMGVEKQTQIPYWIIRNSWGESWGEYGYMRMTRNTNTCNIAWEFGDRSFVDK